MIHTLRFKLVRGFILILIPLALFLYYNNYYAMKVVREEVSRSTADTLSFYVSGIDRDLEEANDYLLRQVTSDASYPFLIDLSLYTSESSAYFLSKQWILRTFMNDLNDYHAVDAFFAYSFRNDDFIATEQSYETAQRNGRLFRSYFYDRAVQGEQRWEVYRFENKSFLIRLVKATQDVYAGAIVDCERFMKPLDQLGGSGNARVLLLTEEGLPLEWSDLPADSLESLKSVKPGPERLHRTFKDPADGKSYMLADASFRWAPLRFMQLIPEQEKLKQLPFFQRVILFIPVGAGVLLIFYHLSLKRILLAPLNALIRGMRKIMQGDFDVRLKDDPSTEFQFLIDTFNTMVTEVRSLKIKFYEEKLRAQQSEFKHLQAQINPHFYLNSLNIIYSLSLLGENRLVEKMAEHMADYFRFITRSHRDSISLEEELEHIRSYMEIQCLRFPDKLTYRIEVLEACRRVPILPLTVQPFVENAIIHGMTKGSGGFHVHLRAEFAEGAADRICVTIADNGKGLPAELVDSFNRGEAGSGTGPKHLGIWNVLHRLRMKYGEKATVRFGNGPDSGAVISMELPSDIDE
ncbi:sensor histidine kinase [Gorillibacterium sp. sgz5001074]|uniref:sensor histidine kinase n=1 Tax=Gorillibacterium sp. sgz5001074 TaxID=3446695 RepID=UPI003F67AA29